MDFDKIFSAIKADALNLARKEFSGQGKQAIQDTEQFLETCRHKLEKWTMALSNGDLDKKEFKKLIDDQQALGQMKLLTKAGISQVKIDSLVLGVKNIIIDNVIKTIL